MVDDRKRWAALAADYRAARRAAHEALTAVKRSYGSVEDGTYGNPTDQQLWAWEQSRARYERSRRRVEAFLAEKPNPNTDATSRRLRSVWRGWVLPRLQF
jgi:hypothetical protein